MDILAPIRSCEEVECLSALGVREFYCGLQPDAWVNNIWLNRRNPNSAGVKNLEELKAIVQAAHKENSQVYLTLNQSSYPADLYDEIIFFVRQIIEYCTVDALIVADPGLIKMLKEKLTQINIHVSSLAVVINSYSVQFFKELGVKRIVFPRYTRIEDLRRIISKLGPDIEYEAFILNDGCVFEEGYCNVSHAFGGAFCHNPRWSYTLIEPEMKNEITAKHQQTFADHLVDYRTWLWQGIKNYGDMSNIKGYPLGMCGLCAMPELAEIGINSLKIVGREASLAKKIASVKLVREILNYVEAGEDKEVIKINAKHFRDPGLCKNRNMCYYR